MFLHQIILAALSGVPQTGPTDGSALTAALPAAWLLLLPLGFILLTSSAMPEERAPGMAVNLLLTWGVAALAYFAVGFALQFGGMAQVNPASDWRGLYWEWYPLDQAIGFEAARLWGFLALQGWFLSGAAATPGAFQLLAGHLSLVGITALLPASALIQRRRAGQALLIGGLTGAALYPLPGNWLWGGGWLFNLGTSLGLGHGFVDLGGASVIFLTGSLAALVALLVCPPARTSQPETAEVVVKVAADSRLTVYAEANEKQHEEILPATIPMPSAYLPILGVLGGGLMVLGWFGLAVGAHAPNAINFSAGQAAAGGLLAALSAALTAAGYSWLTTRKIDPLMTSRGLVAGLVVAAAGAPFMPVWVLAVAGLALGLLLPLLIYLFNQGLRLADELGVLATYGVSAVVSLVLVALFADGVAGQGWNGVGQTDLSRQGVTGLVAAPGLIADWPGQLEAQLLGLAAITVFVLALSFLTLHTVKVTQTSWRRTGLELASPAFTPPSWMKKSAQAAPSSPELEENKEE